MTAANREAIAAQFRRNEDLNSVPISLPLKRASLLKIAPGDKTV